MLKIIAARRAAVKHVEEVAVLNWRDMRLRSRLGQQPLAALWMAMGSTAIIELARAAQADAIVIDMQHGLWDRLSLEAAVGVAASGAPVLVRVAENSAAAIGQALDAGAEGVIVPLVEDAIEAAHAVAAARFPPQGRRSGGGVRPLAAGFVDYCASANERTVVGVMIETVLGVKNAGPVAHTPGVDFVLIGTGDLSLSTGGDDGAVEDACGRVVQACRDAGTPCAIYTPTVGVVSLGFGEAMQRFRSDVLSVPQGSKLSNRGRRGGKR
jgi:2-keto-3-deoxy-L-rhamnonate aldolase RhmA